MLKHTGTKTLETKRLILRKFRPEDARPMYDNWASDDNVSRHMSWATHASVDETEATLKLWLDDRDKDNYYHWIIELKEAGSPIGSIGIWSVSDVRRKASLGYCIGKAWWNRGYTTEAVSAVFDYMFDAVGLERIEAWHHTGNPASGRVMQKAGMRHEGLARKFDTDNTGKPVDCHLYAIIDTDRK